MSIHEPALSTRWHWFIRVSSSSPAPTPFFCVSLCQHTEEEHRGAYKGVPQPGIHYLSMSVHCPFLGYLLCLHPCLFFSFVSLQHRVPLTLRPGFSAGCIFSGCCCYLVLLDHPILFLFRRGLPGDHDGSPIVPTLRHCNLTRRGAGG